MIIVKKLLNKIKKNPVKYSIIFQSYNMKNEIRNTLLSVTPGYQNYNKDLYEVILIENPSDDTLSEEDLSFFDGSITFIKNKVNVPVTKSLNDAIKSAQGEHLIICIDAARIFSNGILKYCDQALQISKKSIVAFHGFHLGLFPQQKSIPEGLYSKSEETQFLKDIKFPNNPKALFFNSSWAGSSETGWFFQMAESNCLMLSRKLFDEIGGFDERLNSPSGGLANLDLYNRMILMSNHRLFFVLGEGTFHQCHGGDTTSGQNKFDLYRQEFKEKTGHEWQYPKRRDYEFLGHVPMESMHLIKKSAVKTIETLSQTRPPHVLKNIQKALTADLPDVRPDLITVFAMHRSKSSYITSLICKTTNAQIPGTTLGKISSNPKGHFEPHEIVILHNRIMSEYGQSWRSISPMDYSSRSDAHLDFCVDRIEKVLKWGMDRTYSDPENMGVDQATFVIKDPRMCRLMPLWEKLDKKLDCTSKRIFLLDHPAKIANSLYKRDAIPTEWGELVWLRYNLDMLVHIRDEDLVINLHTESGENVYKKLEQHLGSNLEYDNEWRPNAQIEAQTQIAQIFDAYCLNQDLDELKSKLSLVEKFISDRSNMFNHIDDLMREVR